MHHVDLVCATQLILVSQKKSLFECGVKDMDMVLILHPMAQNFMKTMFHQNTHIQKQLLCAKIIHGRFFDVRIFYLPCFKNMQYIEKIKRTKKIVFLVASFFVVNTKPILFDLFIILKNTITALLFVFENLFWYVLAKIRPILRLIETILSIMSASELCDTQKQRIFRTK